MWSSWYHSTRDDLETNTNHALNFMNTFLINRCLELVLEKYQDIAFQKFFTESSPRSNLDFSKRYPNFRFGQGTVRLIESLKILGPIFHQRLYRLSHIEFLKSRCIQLESCFSKVSSQFRKTLVIHPRAINYLKRSIHQLLNSNINDEIDK